MTPMMLIDQDKREVVVFANNGHAIVLTFQEWFEFDAQLNKRLEAEKREAVEGD